MTTQLSPNVDVGNKIYIWFHYDKGKNKTTYLVTDINKKESEITIQRLDSFLDKEMVIGPPAQSIFTLSFEDFNKWISRFNYETKPNGLQLAIKHALSLC